MLGEVSRFCQFSERVHPDSPNLQKMGGAQIEKPPPISNVFWMVTSNTYVQHLKFINVCSIRTFKYIEIWIQKYGKNGFVKFGCHPWKLHSTPPLMGSLLEWDNSGLPSLPHGVGN